jgi:drug/metabolite transporter (DMT)-like permease
MIDAIITFSLLASAITANKLVLCALPATFFVAIRMLVAGFFLTAYGFFTKRLSWHFIKEDLLKIMIIAVATTFIPSLLKAYALRGLTSSKAALFGSLDPFVTTLYAYVLWHEKLSYKQWFGIICGFVAALLLITMTSCEQPLAAWLKISLPELAALAAVFISRYGWIEAQAIIKAQTYRPAELNGLLMCAGGLYAFLSAYFAGEMYSTATLWSPAVLIALGYTIVVGNIIAYTLYGYLLKHHSATYVSLASLLVPLFVHFYGFFILGEPLSPVFFASLLVMFIGLLFFSGK